MFLQSIRLLNFKNYIDQQIEFDKGINCIVGDNGSGKTNLLDAIHYLAFTRSAFNNQDIHGIRDGQRFFTVKGSVVFAKRKKSQLVCTVEKGKKKNFKMDSGEYEKLSDHIGKFPVVLITPYNTDLIREGSELRRKYFDSIISQTNRPYLQDLITYNHNLRQRNHLLRFFLDQRELDHDLIAPYNKVLSDCGKRIFDTRLKFVQAFRKRFQHYYRFLSDNKEKVQIEYESQFDDQHWEKTLDQSISSDIDLQRTTFGTHRDRWNLFINGQPLKKFGSQGQQKTFVISLKLAEFENLSKEKRFKPLLLLDDIFDKLDDHRIRKMMELVAKDTFSQIFVTDARPERTQTILAGLNLNFRLIGVRSGKFDILMQSTPMPPA